MIAAARKASVRPSRSSDVRTNRSWASVSGWNARATSAGTRSWPAVTSPEPARGTAVLPGSATTRAPRASHGAASAYQARRSWVSLVVAAARVAGRTLEAVSKWANGLRSLPTPIRPSAHAWSGVVPRPENGSRTTSPGREYRAMNAWVRAAGKLARYEHIGWNEWPHRRCCVFHSGSSAIAGSSSGSSRASWPAAGARDGARFGPADIGESKPP